MRRTNKFYQSINYKAYADADNAAETINIAIAGLAVLFLGWHAIYIIPFNVIGYFFLKWTGRKDPWATQAYGQYNRYSDHYDPFVDDKHVPDWGNRPFGFGNGLRL